MESEAAEERPRVAALSCVSLVLGLAVPALSLSIPFWIGLDAPGLLLRLAGWTPFALLVTALAAAILARRRGERGSLTRTALAWNGFLLIIYVVMFAALWANPVSPS